ncbi:DUF4214 domain-containing protein [Herbaspirillum sp. HC18]|nr:DUF4214 domain-containing protein [Herbaspirillum sp. HC18]
MLRKATLLIAASAAIANAATAAVPAQFIAKQYTEALGRAPDTSGWQSNTNYFISNGCTQTSLSQMAQQIFSSAEYLSKGYTPQEAVLTLYRAVLSRDPDPSGFATQVSSITSGVTAAQIAAQMAASPEFAGMISDICSGNAYRNDWGNSQAIDIGAGTWTQSQLQSCINNNAVCSVPPRTVIFLTSTVTVPAGKILETNGSPNRTQYARQARIVRNSGSFQHLLDVQAGGTVRNIWLSGQRHLYKASPTNLDVVHANIWYSGGTGGLVSGVRSDAPLLRSHLVTVGPGGSMSIDNNLLTTYTSAHIPDRTNSWIADGISQHASGGLIQNNHIIDPTDVGIVLFGHPGATQTSSASSNIIVHAGLDAYGSAGFDTTDPNCVFCQFSGNITNNQILAGRERHVDIMLFAGTAPWAIPDCTSGTRCGTGASVTSNSTIWGDVNQRVKVQVGLLVDGMMNATTSGNALYIEPVNIQPGLSGSCFAQAGGTGIVNHTGHYSGSVQEEGHNPVHSCINVGHF